MLNGSSICFIFRGFLFGHAQSTQVEMRSHVNYSFLMLLLRSQWPVQISLVFKHIWNSFLLQSFLKIIFCVCLGAIQIPEQGLLGVLFIQTLLSSTSCARGNLCVGCCIFRPGFECAALKRWSKYTSVGNCLSVEWLSPGHVRNHCEWHASLQAQCYSVT